MSQPAQVKFPTLPNSDYCVIDNSAPGNLIGVTSTAGAPGYDTTFPGANSQGANVYTNGTIPDFVKRQSVKINNGYATIGFLNPS